MSTQKPLSNMENLLDIAHKTQLALVDEWYAERCFKDKNYMKDAGVFTEGVGVAGVILMLIAFREEASVFSAEEKERARELVAESLGQLCKWSESGFGAASMLTAREDKLFTRDFGYTDTMTYCLSVAVLARYAERKGVIEFDSDTRAAVYSMMARALSATLSSQRADGSWGFATDPHSVKSLYFTYAVSASIADFYDYILGEIALVEGNQDMDDGTSYEDAEVISYLDGIIGDTRGKVAAARQAMREFFVRECLPLLPRVANCEKLEDAALERLGISTAVSYHKYHNLYFAYYLMDAMTITGADIYFDEVLSDENKVAELQKYYKDNGLIPESEQKYLFKPENFSELYRSYYEQALHASRLQYMSASRTGKSFWDSTKSELPITWEHEDSGITAEAEDAIEKSRGKVVDPALIPMALRANTNYCYYVTEKPDLTVERLFESISTSMYKGGEDDNFSDCVENLWDDQYYSLSITEKAIEAIIDFYDYLCKFEHEEVGTHTVQVKESVAEVPVARKSELDIAIEKKISEYLNSDEGKSVIAEAAGAKMCAPTVTASASVSVAPCVSQELTDFILDLSEYVQSTHLVCPEGSEEERTVAALISLAQNIDICKLKQVLAKDTPKGAGETTTEYEHALHDHATRLKIRADELTHALNRDINDDSCDFENLYEFLKQQANK